MENLNTPKELPSVFVGTGDVRCFCFVLLRKEKNIYLYGVLGKDTKNKFKIPIENIDVSKISISDYTHFEVFVSKVQKPYEMIVKNDSERKTTKIVFEHRFLYPKSNDFGKTAFCFLSYYKARKRFYELLKNEKINEIQKVA